MRRLLWLWDRLEETLIVILLTAMTLITFVYVAFTNLYTLFYDLADWFPAVETPAFAIGDFILDTAQTMTWSVAATTSLFAWLIFLGIAYAVRENAHIGVDLLVRLFPARIQQGLAIGACLIFVAYAGLLLYSSIQWVGRLMAVNVGAEDLHGFGIKEWHVAIVVPIGLALVIARLVQAMIAIVRGERSLDGQATAKPSVENDAPEATDRPDGPSGDAGPRDGSPTGAPRP